jgi:hypothetical protein
MQNKIIAVEVKSNYSKNSRGMNVFNRKFKPFKIYSLDTKGLPWYEFIKINPVELF